MPKEQETKKEYVFAVPAKPELENILPVIPDSSAFYNPDKAQALIEFLNLSVGLDKIQEDGSDGEDYTINPRMELRGSPPEYYKAQIDALKKILLPSEIKAISYMLRNHIKNTDKLYYGITKRTDKFYYKQQVKKSVPQEIKDAIEILKGTGINNTLYWLFRSNESYNDDITYCYRQAWKNKAIPNIQTWDKEYDKCYMVLTHDEADERARDYLDDDWIEAVKADRTESSKEDWIEEMLRGGRGEIMNSYDGSEDEQEVNGVTYYIYRTN